MTEPSAATPFESKLLIAVGVVNRRISSVGTICDGLQCAGLLETTRIFTMFRFPGISLINSQNVSKAWSSKCNVCASQRTFIFLVKTLSTIHFTDVYVFPPPVGKTTKPARCTVLKSKVSDIPPKASILVLKGRLLSEVDFSLLLDVD